jgi:hypothetical protein
MDELEIQEQLQPEPQGILLSEEAQYSLYHAGKWARFLGIMGFIGAAFCALIAFAFIFKRTPASLYPSKIFPSIFGGILSIVYGVMALVIFFVSLKLYQFGDGVKFAVQFKSSDKMTEAFDKLYSFFKIKGIILICFLALYLIMIIAMICAAIIGFSMITPA